MKKHCMYVAVLLAALLLPACADPAEPSGESGAPSAETSERTAAASLSETSEESLTQEEIVLRGQLKTALVCEHVPGEAIFSASGEFTEEQLRETLEGLQLPDGWEETLRLYKSSENGDWNGSLTVKEEELLDTMFKLARCDSFYSVAPNELFYPD